MSAILLKENHCKDFVTTSRHIAYFYHQTIPETPKSKSFLSKCLLDIGDINDTGLPRLIAFFTNVTLTFKLYLVMNCLFFHFVSLTPKFGFFSVDSSDD